MQGWLLLTGATLLEVSGTVSMKLSEGFSRMVPSVLLFFFYAMSFILLVIALKRIEITILASIVRPTNRGGGGNRNGLFCRRFQLVQDRLPLPDHHGCYQSLSR